MGDRLPRVEDVQIAALHRGLRFDLATTGPGRRLDRAAVLDHLQRTARAFELPDDLFADAAAVARGMQAACLLGVLPDGFERRDDVVTDLIRAELTPADRVDPIADLRERDLRAAGEIVDLAAEAFDVARRREEPSRPAEDEGEQERQDQERDQREDEERFHPVRGPCRCAAGAQPAFRARRAAVIAGAISNRSPITTTSAKSAIGASGSRLTATIVSAVCMPTLCWMAPEMPRARYSAGLTILPVWPICCAYGIQPESTAARVAPTAPPSSAASSWTSLKPSSPPTPRPPARGFLDALDHRDERQAQLAFRGPRLDRAGRGGLLCGHDVRADGDDPP